MLKKISLLAVLISLTSSMLWSQLISSDPAFPIDSQPVTITFNAAEGNGGLAGYSGDVYAHTGVITNLSTQPSDWKHVKTNWGENTPDTKLTKIGTDLYQLQISPSIRNYYGVPSNESILQMAFVFRSEQAVGGSYLEGKTASGGDIYVDVYELTINVNFLNPSESGLLANLNQNIPVEVAGTMCDSIKLYVDNSLYNQVAGTSLNVNLTASSTGKHRVKAVASAGASTAVDSFYYYVKPTVSIVDPPSGVEQGINYINANTVILASYAPYKNFAFVLGDFNDWEYGDEGFMKKSNSGNLFWVQLNNLQPGQEYIYQYEFDGSIRVGDPYAEKISDPWNDSYIPQSTYPNLIDYPSGKTTGIATVFQTNQNQYTWTNTSFNAPDKDKLVIYELLIRDFSQEQNILTLIDSLSYLNYLGVNAIELMPVNEFEGNLSWGYNPDFYFAFDKYYGPKDAFKTFIDSCHSMGIAVIMDIALNHSFGQSPMVQMYWDAANNQPAGNNPWYNSQPKHDFNVGYDFNHESPATKYFTKRVIEFWIEEFKVDGYRFDLSKGFTQNNTLGNVSAWGQYDQSRINILEDYADHIWSVNPNAYVILEHFADNSEETVLANYGMMPWGNMNWNYAQCAMGYSTDCDVSWGVYTTRGWNQPNLVTYMESHDEERMMFKNLSWGNSNGSYDITNLPTALARVELASAFFFPLPGPKMIWQFEELGYDISKQFNGELGEKPLHWEYFFDANRNRLFHVMKALIELKKEYPVFSTSNFTFNLSGLTKRINLNHTDMNVTIIGNFNVSQNSIDPNFQHTGTWYSYFTGDSIQVNDIHAQIQLAAGEYKLFTDVKLDLPILQYIPVGIDEEQSPLSMLGVFPNPSSGMVYFEIPELKQKADFSIYTLDGKIVYHKDIQAGVTGNFSWSGKTSSGNTIPKGLYFARLVSGSEIYTYRFIRN